MQSRRCGVDERGTSVVDMPGAMSGEQPQRGQVRALLRRCGATRDHAERAALLNRLGDELDQAATEITAGRGEEITLSDRELIAGLRAQAGMVRYMADLERAHLARAATCERPSRLAGSGA